MASTLSVEETIPATLQPDVDAALAWFNAQQDITFKVTGIIDAVSALAQRDDRTLRLILCGGDRCEQHTFSIAHRNDGTDVVSAAEQQVADESSNSKLDPPPGALRNWIDNTISQHQFTFIVFYRGLW